MNNVEQFRITPEYLLEQGLSLTFPERFWSKVDKTSSPFGCWLWIACLVNGYGSIGSGGKHGRTIMSNRAVWILTRGPIPDRMCVCHNCPGGDNRACCNPDHLFLDTRAGNNADARKKGVAHPPPHRKGERNNLAKLTWEQVRQIRGMYVYRKVGCDQISKKFGVDPSLILLIVKHKIWKEDQ